MTEKTFKQSEINEISNKVFIQYHQLFQNDKITFNEWLLAKNIITEIQVRLDEHDGGKTE